MKKLIITISFICLCILNLQWVSATNVLCPFYSEINKFIDLEKGPTILIDGKENQTFWQFSNNDLAFAKIKLLCNELILTIKNENNLDDLSMNTWLEYSIYLDELTDVDFDQYSTLKTFLNVCDNTDRNHKVLELIKNPSFDEEEMAMLLPYNSEFSKEYYSRPTITPRATFNVTAAVNYANKWATGYNEYEYRWWPNNDCTNFVSQIAKNGGASQNTSYGRTDYRAWYYKGHSESDYTISWIRADYFVRHWGVKYSTTSYRSFASNISKGSFIASDYDLDGKYDHCGFVVQADANEATYNGRTFKDFKVAQHTSNYVDWASRGGSYWITSGGLKVVLKTPY